MFVFVKEFFALKLHARTVAPASRDLQENDIEVSVRLDLLEKFCSCFLTQ